jgi:GNAT superfamily N-acetyltransferase
MRVAGFLLREATADDLPGISAVRLAVRENATTTAELDRRGITNESVAASFMADSKGWVAVEHDQIVGFSIADRADRSIFALFVLPACEGRGLGSGLLDLAVNWLWVGGADRIWLTTDPGTGAAGFYERRGWTAGRIEANGEQRFELTRPEQGEVKT